MATEMNQTVEKLMYLLDHLDSFIEQTIYNVLSDSNEDPQFSSVTTNNLIKNYIDIMLVLDQRLDYCDVEGYLKSKCFSSEEIAAFMQKKDIEAQYYVGKQY